MSPKRISALSAGPACSTWTTSNPLAAPDLSLLRSASGRATVILGKLEPSSLNDNVMVGASRQNEWEGKVFSAEAFLKGVENIKTEVAEAISLNRASNPSTYLAGEIQHAENAPSFAKVLCVRRVHVNRRAKR
jgi:hypothetical protein